MPESVLSTMKFVRHMRPRIKRKLSTEEQQKLSAPLVCGLCSLPFQADLGSGKCPEQSQNCSHLLFPTIGLDLLNIDRLTFNRRAPG
jgi:hypothetical protein